MKTSDVLNIGYARFYGSGRISSRFDVTDSKSGGVRNTLKMVRDGDRGSIRDFVRFDQYNSGCSDLESELELVADNVKSVITIHVSTPLELPVMDEFAILKGLNTINRLGNSCAASYDPVNRCIETKACISFAGFDVSLEGRAPDEIIDFSASPEIEGFINLVCQVINVASDVTHFVSENLIQ